MPTARIADFFRHFARLQDWGGFVLWFDMYLSLLGRGEGGYEMESGTQCRGSLTPNGVP